ncbi:MAG: glutamine synthetase adenylyltransferase [Chloroflexi bacterium HGW-Chloroflexi-6]|nr:MAG: glutamine synthetase adenylyltransferase [Chloroflexi bacterium HGW-Chloroflexi-6]
METSLRADQLLSPDFSEPAAQSLLDTLGFNDSSGSLRRLRRMAASSPDALSAVGELMPHLLASLSACADPDQALINLERFASDGQQAAEIFAKLVKNPRALEILVAIFAGSQFLTEILLRSPARLDLLTDRESLTRLKKPELYEAEGIESMRGLAAPGSELDSLRRYQHGELLRIGACDLLDLYDLPTVTSQLSALADGMARACLVYASDRTGVSPDGFVVLAMGKLGGRELNYSSDIDLLFLVSKDSPEKLRLGQQFIEALSSVTPEGFLYRVDMRLRPWGRDGSLASTLEGYLDYLSKNARLWEKQALIKARPIAGDFELGLAFRREIEPVIFGQNPETVRASVYAMKQRTEELLRQKGREWGEVKLGEGSIRDVEFAVQFMQLAYGENPRLRKRATLVAITRLVRFGHLTAPEGRTLSDGYIFLRTVEHFLQMMHYRQTYTLPSDPGALTLLARRLGFRGSASEAREKMLERYERHSHAIRAIYAKYVGGIETTPPPQPADEAPNPLVQQHLARLDAEYASIFSPEEIHKHALMAESLGDDNLVRLEARPLDDQRWEVTIVAYDYLGELSLICGLFFVYGLDIQAGEIFTYELLERATRDLPGRSSDSNPPAATRKIVDVFTVQPVGPKPEIETWQRYTDDLSALLRLMHTGKRREARSELAKRVGATFQKILVTADPLYPIEIKIDNRSSARYTSLRLDAPDTIGFLYEFTNALSLTRTYIARMVVQSHGSRVNDLLFVTDKEGRKITSYQKQRELRTAAVLIKHFTHLLPRCPNPASALLHFREFIEKLFERPNWPDELASIERPEVLGNLAHLLGVSDFLWDDFLRMQYTNLFPVVSDLTALDTAKSRSQLQAELGEALKLVHLGPQPPHEDAPWRKVLNDFKDREMFRLDMRHLLGHTREFWDFSAELTDLTEVIINNVYYLCAEDLRSLYGNPRRSDGTVSQMSVMALGKCGGRELGFASDIELMFLYDEEGQTDGPQVIPASEFHEHVVRDFLAAIQARQEGIFQVDLQLRPYGKAGSMAVSLDSFRRYYAPEGPAWAYERQALVKMRPVAGDPALGAQACALRDSFVYTGIPFDVTAMRAMRERQVRHLVSAGTFNAKYSPGGLVDIEYLIQGLQITHGAADPSLRQPNIRQCMDAMHKAGILNDDDYTRLHKAHTFLRWLIDSMRVVRGNAKDVNVPAYGSEEFAFLARRLRYVNEAERLRDDLVRYQTDVQEINTRLLT